VLTHRWFGKGQAACTTLQAYENPMFQQILYRLMRQLAGYIEQNRELGVGLLGYSPNVGKGHGLGVQHTTGLSLKAVSDLHPQRLDQARQDFPHVKIYETSEAFSLVVLPVVGFIFSIPLIIIGVVMLAAPESKACQMIRQGLRVG